jgi:hypothetical protein
MTPDEVRAVALPALDGRSPDPTVAALERQTRRPSEVGVGLVPTGGLGPAWIWLVDGAAVPEADALERLLEATRATSAVIFAGKVVLPDGALDPLALPVPAVTEPEVTLGAFERGLLAIRAARRGSLLVRAGALDPPAVRSARDDLLWTARLLLRERGFLVPASVAVRAPGPPAAERRRARAGLADWLRLVISNGLEPAEKPWFAFRLAEEALAAARR